MNNNTSITFTIKHMSIIQKIASITKKQKAFTSNRLLHQMSQSTQKATRLERVQTKCHRIKETFNSVNDRMF